MRRHVQKHCASLRLRCVQLGGPCLLLKLSQGGCAGSNPGTEVAPGFEQINAHHEVQM